MTIYYINLLLVILYSVVIRPQKSVSRKKAFYFICFFQLFVIFFLRDKAVGTDTQTYADYFYHFVYNTPDRQPGMEIGFKALNYIVAQFTSDFNVFLCIIGLLIFLPLFIFLYHRSKDPFLSIYCYITLFFYYQSFNQMRQILAVTFILCSLKYIENNSFGKFTACVLVASCFHISALVFFPMFFLRYIAINFKTIVVYIYATIILFLAYRLFSYIFKNIPRYTSYFSSSYYEQISVSTVINLAFRLIIILVLLIFFKPVIKNDKRNIILYHSMFCLMVFQFFSLNHTMLARIPTYSFASLIILIPEVCDSIHDRKQKRFIFVGIVIFLSAYFVLYMKIGSGNSAGLIPYKTIF